MLTAAQKEQWLKDLRSGEFEQGRGKLCSEERQYCCLGVLAERVAVKKELIGYKYHYTFSDNECAMPWAGMVPDNIIDDDAMVYLVRMNDNDRNTFDEIADWIEANVVTKG